MTKEKYLSIMFYSFYVLTIIILLNIRIIIVNGQSMYPTLEDRQLCVMLDTHRINDGDIVVLNVKNTDLPTNYIIKRFCESKSTADFVWVEGDNKANSLDSRSFGLLESERIIGKVLLRVPVKVPVF